jgi:hypothetical protein
LYVHYVKEPFMRGKRLVKAKLGTIFGHPQRYLLCSEMSLWTYDCGDLWRTRVESTRRITEPSINMLDNWIT